MRYESVEQLLAGRQRKPEHWTDRQWLKSEKLSAPLMSFSATVQQYRDGTKTVTRRGGPMPTWSHLRQGTIIEGVEWSPRVGRRWVCECGALGSTSAIYDEGGMVRWFSDAGRMPKKVKGCSCRKILRGPAHYRNPRRLGLALVLDVRVERLGDITEEEVRREGFSGLDPAAFVSGYCGATRLGFPAPRQLGGKARKAADWQVTRIEFERFDP